MATADLLPAPPAAPLKDPSPRRWSADEFRRVLDLGIFAGRPVTLAEGQIVERRAWERDPRPVAFTQSEFCRLWDANFFTDQQVQLIGGEIVQESPMNPPHATGIRKVTRALERIFPTGHDVRVQVPLDLTPNSRPHPDVSVVLGSMEDYAERHPTSAVLVVEVSESTLADDTTTKAELYATAGIPDYWVLDVTNRVLIVYRDPVPLAPGGTAYRNSRTFSPGESVSPVQLPGVSVAVTDLLP